MVLALALRAPLYPVAAATALHLHANTVTQRLDRVARLLGGDWAGPERRLEVLHIEPSIRCRGDLANLPAGAGQLLLLGKRQ